MNVTGRTIKQMAAPKGFGAIVGKRAGGSWGVPRRRRGICMGKRDVFVTASLLSGSLLVVQALVSFLEAMALHA